MGLNQGQLEGEVTLTKRELNDLLGDLSTLAWFTRRIVEEGPPCGAPAASATHALKLVDSWMKRVWPREESR